MRTRAYADRRSDCAPGVPMRTLAQPYGADRMCASLAMRIAEAVRCIDLVSERDRFPNSRRARRARSSVRRNSIFRGDVLYKDSRAARSYWLAVWAGARQPEPRVPVL